MLPFLLGIGAGVTTSSHRNPTIVWVAKQKRSLITNLLKVEKTLVWFPQKVQLNPQLDQKSSENDTNKLKEQTSRLPIVADTL